MSRSAKPSPVTLVSRRVMATGAKLATHKDVSLTVEGVEHLPKRGPVLIAARHYHHLYDGCALIQSTNRPLHILVALDWVKGGPRRALMERACQMAGWPVVLRDDGLTGQRASAYRDDERRRYLREGVRASVELLRAGEALVVFPEGYPNVDPAFTPKSGDDFLPFRPGFIRLVELTQRDGRTRVPIVPAGFVYEPRGTGWSVALRYGEPLWLDGSRSRDEVAALVEGQVRRLSEEATNDIPDTTVVGARFIAPTREDERPVVPAVPRDASDAELTVRGTTTAADGGGGMLALQARRGRDESRPYDSKNDDRRLEYG